MKTELDLRKVKPTVIVLTLFCGVCSLAQAQNPFSTAEVVSQKQSHLSTGLRPDEKVISYGLSERERLLLERLDQQHREPSRSDVQLDNTSGSDSKNLSSTPAEDLSTPASIPQWQYGGFVDLGYLLNFNHPANHLFRSRGTAFRVDSVFLNMAAFYVKKKATEESRWGVELTAQAGKDAEFFGFSATAPNIGGYKFLRQLGPTNGLW